MSEKLKKFLPHLISIAAFVVISGIYFYPAFTGNKLKQGDITNWRGMSQEIQEFRRMFGEEPLWTNSMFGGMPAFQISVKYPNDILGTINSVLTLGLPHPANLFFLYMAGFYLLMISLRVRPSLAAIASVAFAFSTYYIIILEAGHNSKAHAIGYMAPALAGIIWAYRGKFLLGGAITAFFMALEIGANHVQITYYFAFLVLFFAIAKLVEAIREKTVPSFVKASAVLLVAAVLGVLANANVLWNTYNYGKYTTRGTTELTIRPDGASNEANLTTGLERDYVTQWSYGIGETFTFLIPNAHGGASGALIDENTQRQDPAAYNRIAEGYQQTNVFPNTYWGDQPFTSGPVYAGALVVLLFLLGAFFIHGPVKWALLATAALTIALSWGKNLMGLTDFFLDTVPGYDKFRAVTIILAIAELVLPLLGFLFVKKIIDKPEFLLEQKKKFFAVGGSLILLLLLFLALPDTFFPFLSTAERTAFNAAMENPSVAPTALDYAETLKESRITEFRSDTFRSLAFILIGLAIIWALAIKRIKPMVFLFILGFAVLADLWPVNKRFLNNEKVRGQFVQWEEEAEASVGYEASPVDMAILERELGNNPRLKDAVDAAVSEYRAELKEKKSPRVAEDAITDVKFAALRFNTNYRVLPIQGTFQDARTAYFHSSVGGYHGAKLKRIQELYDFYITEEMSAIVRTLQNNPTQETVNNTLRNADVLNMLNTKYIIYNNDAPPLQNPFALGGAWFVEDIITVSGANAEMSELGGLTTSAEAVVDSRFSDLIQGWSYSEAPDAAIAVEEHLPNYIKYIYDSPVSQAVIFSEIYYPDGWNAYIDGERTDYFRANYLLRGMIVPAGTHEIEFKFEPESYEQANIISTVAAAMVLLLLALGLWKGRERPIAEDADEY